MEKSSSSSSCNTKSEETQNKCEPWRLPSDLTEHGRDIFWTILCVLASALACFGWYTKLWVTVLLPTKVVTESEAFYHAVCILSMQIINGGVPCIAYICNSLLCPRPIGHHGKFLVYFLTVVAAVITRNFVPHKTDALMALTGHTLYLHALCQVLRVASDVGGWDMLIGAFMQVLVYTAPGGQTSAPLIAVLGACSLVICFNYIIGYKSLKLPLVVDEKLLPL